MKLLSSLKNRVFLASALVAGLSLAFAIRYVAWRVTREAERDLGRELQQAAELVERSYAARLDTLRLVARLIADLPKLKAAVDTADPATVQPVAADYRERAGADLLTVTGRDGGLLAVLGAPGAAMRGAPAIQQALAGGEATTFESVDGMVLQIVTVPISIDTRPPEVLGALGLGFALDDALAEQLKAVTHCEVALGLDDRVRASTLPREHHAALAGLLEADGAAVLSLGDNEYVAIRRRLPAGSGTGPGPVAVVLRSRTERLAFLRTFRAGLGLATLVAVAVAVLLSYAVARTVTRPMAAITAVMREMTKTGDLTQKIQLHARWDDEDARVLGGAFNTLTDSIARFQREVGLRERLSALGRLSTVIAHEIRNPLMIIKAGLRTLRREGVSAAEIREVAADIDHEVARLNRIVEDVLDFARPVRLEYAPTDLNELCRDAVAATMAGEGRPGFRLALDPALRVVVTDGERLRTALVNILSNARDAVLARSGGDVAAEAAEPAVEVRTRELPGHALIEVEDRGGGIDPADLPHIFEPYYTTKRTGTGLGLAIAKNIVDSLGGTLSASSRPPSGTRMRIELPAGAPGRTSAPAA